MRGRREKSRLFLFFPSAEGTAFNPTRRNTIRPSVKGTS